MLDLKLRNYFRSYAISLVVTYNIFTFILWNKVPIVNVCIGLLLTIMANYFFISNSRVKRNNFKEIIK